MKKVLVNQLSDGRFIVDDKEAEKLENEIQFLIGINNLIDIHVASMDEETVRCFITENRSELKEIFGQLM